MINADVSALDAGGVLAQVPWGSRRELRVTVRRSRGERGDRRYDLREWWQDAAGSWCPGRRGINGLCGADLRKLTKLLGAVCELVPRRHESSQ